MRRSGDDAVLALNILPPQIQFECRCLAASSTRARRQSRICERGERTHFSAPITAPSCVVRVRGELSAKTRPATRAKKWPSEPCVPSRGECIFSRPVCVERLPREHNRSSIARDHSGEFTFARCVLQPTVHQRAACFSACETRCCRLRPRGHNRHKARTLASSSRRSDW